jgi:hypothetical protein
MQDAVKPAFDCDRLRAQPHRRSRSRSRSRSRKKNHSFRLDLVNGPSCLHGHKRLNRSFSGPVCCPANNLPMKTRLHPHGCVANPRDSTGHHCGLRLALGASPSVSFHSPVCGTARQGLLLWQSRQTATGILSRDAVEVLSSVNRCSKPCTPHARTPAESSFEFCVTAQPVTNRICRNSFEQYRSTTVPSRLFGA